MISLSVFLEYKCNCGLRFDCGGAMHRRRFLGAAALGIPFIFGRCGWGQTPDAGPDSSFDPSLWIDDLAITNARILTLDAARPEAQAVLVHRGDFAVRAGDPRKMQAPDYFKLNVDATILGGKVVFGA